MEGNNWKTLAVQARVAGLELIQIDIEVVSTPAESVDNGASQRVRLLVKSNESDLAVVCEGQGVLIEEAIGVAVSTLCIRNLQVSLIRQLEQKDGQQQCVVAVAEAATSVSDNPRAGVGRATAESTEVAVTIATVRAANHSGLLKSAYRANNQKLIRGWSRELTDEIAQSLGLGSLGELKRLEVEGTVLEHLNRVASAAIVTAANSPEPESILSLFDTSAWLYDASGRKRNSFTDTNLWLAWYPGVEDAARVVDQVIVSMPAAPESKIPWIVKFFENPASWFRFRGAIDLEDHDVLHVLLGRGLQDQDEAFVLGFAMGTAKKVSWLQYHLFKFALSRLYPEPYRIPRYLHPAFDLGVKCGQETGLRDLYKQPLREIRQLSIEAARRTTGIDAKILLRYYRQEQLAIPTTIASLRLP